MRVADEGDERREGEEPKKLTAGRTRGRNLPPTDLRFKVPSRPCPRQLRPLSSGFSSSVCLSFGHSVDWPLLLPLCHSVPLLFLSLSLSTRTHPSLLCSSREGIYLTPAPTPQEETRQDSGSGWGGRGLCLSGWSGGLINFLLLARARARPEWFSCCCQSEL